MIGDIMGMDSNSKQQQADHNNTHLSSPIALFTFICAIAALISSYFSYRTMHDLQANNENRYRSYRLAEQLSASSDQLSLMARTYVATGNAKYLQFYHDILAMSNGTKLHPNNSHRIYWALLMPQNANNASVEGKKKAFKKLLLESDLTEQEFAFLDKAKIHSNQLTTLELQAFALAEQGTENSIDYPHSEQRLAALSLLYSERYFLEKSKMMTLINEFFESQDSLSIERKQTLQLQHDWATNLAILSFILLLILLGYSLRVHKYSKEHFVKVLRKEVANRTYQLFEKREQLKTVIKEMESTRNQLVEAEKMASLGDLVCGVAHEVNTPLGVSVTLASHLHGETANLHKKVENGQLKRSELECYCNEVNENCQLLLSNLARAANLIRSFKQVAVDQGCDEVRTFKISDYIKEVLLSLHHKLKKTDIHVRFEVPENEQEVHTYPGAVAQIVTNLVMNALIHGFDNGLKSGEILFSIEFDESNVMLTVSDNGNGMEVDVCDKIFDPFFTTKRGSGGSGLGMNIVYNLVVHQLLGSISCTSRIGEASTFLLCFPIRVDVKASK
ncbi:MAG: signal transduction histidine kinase [Psychromonas sp.]|jgi:signal transduction histidine kinase